LTACGKTHTAIQLAKKINGEIVSADSMQVYKGMDIGTAKPKQAERENIPHYLIDVVHPDENFSAAQYKRLADAAIRDIHSRGRTAILTGGTGFYLNAVLYGHDFIETDEAEQVIRKELHDLAETRGAGFLHDELKTIDPASAAFIHPNNVKRVARAVSFYRSTGIRISDHNKTGRSQPPVYDTVFIVLYRERAELNQKINERVCMMFDEGLVDEVRGLLSKGYGRDLVSMQGIGYKETVRYLDGEYGLHDAMEAIMLATRQYAKRQSTWFRHRAEGAEWINMDEWEESTWRKIIRT
jgi:tRNA dimethylallyltransferase